MAVIAVINHKGGVGKTTTTVNLGAALQELGRRVLLVDLDPQASLTIHLGIRNPETLPFSCGDAIKAAIHGSHSPTFREIMIRSPAGLDLIPSGRQLADAEPLLGQGLERAFTLRGCLTPLRDEYDYILIDCLPSRNYLAYNAMAAADAILVPTQTDYLAVQGLANTFQTAVTTQQRFNPRLRVLGVLLTMVDARTKHSRWVMGAVRRSFEGKVRVFDTVVGLQVGFKDSSKEGVSILRYNAASVSAMAYRSLANEVVGATEELLRESEGRSADAEVAALVEVAKSAMHQAESLARVEGSLASRLRRRPAAEPSLAFPDTSSKQAVPIETARDSELQPQGPDRKVSWEPHTCKYLGLAEDQTRQLDHPDAAHRCWVDGTPFVIDLEWQGTVCRQQWDWACPRYARYVYHVEEPKPSLYDRLLSWLHLS
jgi:chromosome partitioning protein